MSKELIKLWMEYIATERYEQLKMNAKAAGMGMGFLAGNPDTFTDFMDWLINKEGTLA